ncbi:MAG: universal stress protein [Desulfobulbaceae bacterium]|nr:MAG: universal stress protein [Desulfobulbaceae bacterium]
MKEITQIVVPVDFGSHTDKLVEFATYMASKLGAKLSFIHVNESSALGDMMMGSPSFRDLDEQRQAKAEQKMAHVLEDYGAKCPGCTGDVVAGDAVDEIVAFAKKQEADLIIISTHGTKGLGKILLGSVAERVVKRAPCPTLTINPFEQ